MDAPQQCCQALDGQHLHARIPLHRGVASIRTNDGIVTGIGEFLLPADGASIVGFKSDSERLGSDFGGALLIEGAHGSTTFRLHAAQCYTRIPGEGAAPGWSLVSPINGPVAIDYGFSRPTRRLNVWLNNFDYRCGDPVTTPTEFTRIGTPLKVQCGSRTIEFCWRANHDALLQLVRAGLLRSATLTEFGCDILEGESEEELEGLALDVAGLCTLAMGVSVSPAMLRFLDEEGNTLRVLAWSPVHSRFRSSEIVADFNLPQLFRECAVTYQGMRRDNSQWRKLASYCGSLEDAPYMEQKFASLMMALEYFMRNALSEAGHNSEAERAQTIQDLVGATRRALGWNVPKHYRVGSTVRLFRNAVMHGDELPTSDSVEFRKLFDKWRLFLFRRVLMRLGYTGFIESPHKGWTVSSAVNDFSEERNSYEPSDGTDALSKFFEHLRLVNRKAASHVTDNAV